ncbi:MAG: CoA transferase [Chloroflexi bacterium]|nr:CoA transferase [Chloroflexota bacterium]
MNGLPLDGIKVLDVTHAVAGPFCTMLLADAGAEVIKVEPPHTGEMGRQGRPHITSDTGEPLSLRYVQLNRGKKTITLNLRDAKGKALFKRLVGISDVVAENFSPGTMERLGLGYDVLRAINPKIVYASVSGYGKRDDLRGPYSNWAANNPAAQAMSGLMDVTGEPDGPPCFVGASLGDTIPGIWTAYSIMLALEHRHRTGLGQAIDIAMYDCLVMHNDHAPEIYDLTGVSPGRGGEVMYAPWLCLEANDGFVMVSGGGGSERWKQLWQAIGRPDLASDPQYTGPFEGSFVLRVIKPAIEVWSRQKGKWEVDRVLREIGFTGAPVQTAKEVYDCPQLEARKMWVELEVAGKKFRQPHNPAKLSACPDQSPPAVPLLGEHNDYVYQQLLGLEPGQLQELQAASVI